MTDEQRRNELRDLDDLMAKIESGKYKCGFAASSALKFTYAELTALRASLDRAKGQLCRARGMMSICLSALVERARGRDAEYGDLLIGKLRRTLSSSSPCPHEEEAKRLREALDAACDWIAVRNREKANGFRLSAKEG